MMDTTNMTDTTLSAKTDKKPTNKSSEDIDDTNNTDDKEATSPTEDEDSNQELQELRAALAEAEDKHLRTLAEVENFKRRMARDKDDLAHEVLARIVKDLLCVLDSFDKGKASDSSDDAYVQGMKLVEEQFRTVLTNIGLQPIAAVGELFDPNLHQAIQRVEVDSEADNDRIQKELAKGYTLKGRLLRPSMVSVGIYSGNID